MNAGRSSGWTLDRDRAGAGVLTGLAVALLGYALVAGLAVSLPVKPADVMKLFAIDAPRPPAPREKPPPPHPHHAEREGASAPPNKRSTATPVAAPVPVVPPIQPPPVITATVAATGADASSGAALMAGPGTGAGGQGNGLGNGRSGTGRGDGGTPAELISRKIRLDDLPAGIVRNALSGVDQRRVGMHFTVTAKGRVVGCRVTRSSGDASLDGATCAAMVAKLRYSPERDASGRAVAVDFDGYQRWDSRYGADGEPDDD